MAPQILGVSSNYGCLFPQVHHLVSFHFLSLWLPNLQQKKNRWGILKSLRKGNDPKGFGYIWMSDLHNKTAFYGIIFCPFVSG